MRHLTYIVAAALAVAAMPAIAHDYSIAGIEIGHPWTRATSPSARVGVGYLTLTNNGDTADRLVGASSPAAARAELHMTEMSDGIMRMRAVPDGLEIPPGGTVELAPGGYHLMLMELAQPIAEGDAVPLMLEFEHAGSVEVELMAGSAGATGGAAPDQHGGHH